MSKQMIVQMIAQNKTAFEQMSDAIWTYAETCYQEIQSSATQRHFLEREGFQIQCPIGEMGTAFIASYGAGRPVIALLGEYDALPGLSQESGKSEKSPLLAGGSGHGCGHHMLGTAAVEAAVAVKHWMEQEDVHGTIRYYGCPAEEGGGGKIHMIRAGAFFDVDIALSWHPQQDNFGVEGSKAIMQKTYAFQGISAHAATNPQQGRSALDAAELMNIGVNFLREHLPLNTSVQYAFQDAGGRETNIIPDHASVRYTIRAEKSEDLNAVSARVEEIANGAALMAGVKFQSLGEGDAIESVRKNETLLSVIQENARALADADYTEKDFAEAARFSSDAGQPLRTGALGRGKMRASTDFGNVSQILPSAMFCLATYAAGTPLHSWSAVAQGKLGYAHKAMHRAAEILATTAADLFMTPALIEQAAEAYRAG